MSNSWFQFRQFIIHQDRCAMKVSTDACIQGAWIPLPPNLRFGLDIGTGTGLLSLMIAQRAPDLHLDGIELDPSAVSQATENAAGASFGYNLKMHQADARQWTAAQPYDLIICNPPFFKNSLKGPDAARNAARHTESLSPEELLEIVLIHLAPEGYVSLLWPPDSQEYFGGLAGNKGLFLRQQLLVQDRPGTRVNRSIAIYSRKDVLVPEIETLIIKDDGGAYSASFKALMQPYYLHL